MEALIERAVGESTPIVVTFKLNNVAIDLTGATVLFYAMWAGNDQGQNWDTIQWSQSQSSPAPHIEIDGAACTHNDSGGVVTYSPLTTTFDTAGSFFVQYRITFASGVVEIVGKPLGSIRLEISPSLASL
jgi:hypothetical protein